MPYTIDFANKEDEPLLREIFIAADMDLVGDVDDHAVIKNNGVLCGGGLLYQMESDLFHLLTLAVQQDGRSRGVGSALLKKILVEPWACCRDAVFKQETEYRVTTVARGSSRAFYLKNGLVDCRFSELVEPFEHQCLNCPDVDHCDSAAMEYLGGRTIKAMTSNQECGYAV